MNVTDYTYLMNKPDAISEKQAEALGSVLNEFPYFQSARALRLKGLYNQNSFKYNYALKVTAAHTTDRSVLFDFITSETFASIGNELYDSTIADINTISVDSSEMVSSEEITKKITEVPMDAVEQSVLDSIKEATGLLHHEPSHNEEQSSEQFIIAAEKEVETSIFEESVETEFTPIKSRSFLVDGAVLYEEPVKPEEDPTDNSSDQLVDNAEKEETTIIFEKIEETAFYPVEESKTVVIPDTTAVVWEEMQKSIEVEIDTIIEEPKLTSKETATIVFEEAQQTGDATIALIEESDIISIPDTTAVVWEEDVIEQNEVSEIDTSNVVYEEREVLPPSAEPVKKAEENLEIGKPLDFSANEKHSFQEWLQLARLEPIDRTGVSEKNTKETAKSNEPAIEISAPIETIDEEKKKKEEIINNFIKTNPKIPPIKQTAIVPAVQLDSNNEENSYLMTETLARVYLEQKKYTKAIQAYKILILKYPEKISFFADRISDIKILQQNNNN